MRFDRARAVADAVLFEGYALYPYRPTATKNQLRWQFGVLVPRIASEGVKTDPWFLETEALIEAEGRPQVTGRLRFLRLRRRRIEKVDGSPCDSIEVDGRLLVPWDEGELREHDFACGQGALHTLELSGDRSEDIVRDAAGQAACRVVRDRAPISLRIAGAIEPIAGGLHKLRVRVENLGSAPAHPRTPRDAILPSAAVGTHILFAVEDGAFLSLIDPPAGAEAAARACKNVGVFPILAGRAGERDLLLAAPIILYDHPQVAPESPGDLFDATEIDEILTLRTLTLTDEEKRQARASDPRVAALIDRVDAMPPEVMARLHGALRQPGPAPGGLRPGGRVRLRPGARKSDAQDLFLAGRLATIRELKHDVDGRPCLAVTIDDDPAAELHRWRGRYHYFYADELEALDV